jgi:hypothetical protein
MDDQEIQTLISKENIDITQNDNGNLIIKIILIY